MTHTMKFIALTVLLGSFSFTQAAPLNLTYSHIVIDRDEAIYNPTNEFIFSSVIKTDHIANPLGKYYLYYAPHDAPGGISLAYADNIQGPYTEYTANPLLTNNHQGRFKVTHVSSPHVMWMPQYNKYIMYFHGENTTTRWAYSTDGINWDVAKDNIALTTSMWGSNFSECSYARVFEYSIPGVGNRYVMMMMLIKSGHGRRIGLAISNDGKKFTPYDEALISPTADEGTQLSGAFYWPHNGKHYVVYHGNSGNLHYTEVGARFNQEIHHGIFYNPESSYPEANKASAPFLMWENNRWNMFYDIGKRLDQTIGYAFETPTTSNITIDNTSNGFSFGGSWETSTSTKGYYGANYLHDNSAGTDTGDWAKWKPNFPRSGYYKVMVRWPAYSNRPNRVKYKIYSQGQVTEVFKSQQRKSGSWVYLGRFYFDAGSSENNRLTLDAGSDSGYVIADAARFIFDGN
ncbi:Xanthan lyase [Thalassocella blandensis]|nr:Xanthan lyase [Thalassocella blandensis]